jgi:hypothetical protein
MASSTAREERLASAHGLDAASYEPEGYRVVEILGGSARKRTRTALVEGHGRRAVLKSIAKDAPPEWWQRFETELDIHRHSSFARKPRLIDAGQGWFLLEHVEGRTLRRRTEEGLSADATVEALRAVVCELSRTRRDAGTEESLAALAESGAGRLRNLLASGPTGSVRSVWNQRLCGVAAASLPALMRVKLREALVAWSRAGARVVAPFGHDDLHGNNVLLGPEGAVVIDFEQALQPGCWLVDTWYLLATTVAGAPAAVRASVRSAVRRVVLDAEPMLADGYDRFEAVFTGAALANGRFARSTPGAAQGHVLVRATTALVRG